MASMYKRGWFQESQRHSLSARGIKTNYYALKRPTEFLIGGYGDNKPDEMFNESELMRGTKHEMEHTSNRNIAKEIAKDHLSEDPQYYKKLERMEQGFMAKKYYAEQSGVDTAAKASSKTFEWFMDDGRAKTMDMKKDRRQQLYKEVADLTKAELQQEVVNEELSDQAAERFLEPGGAFDDEAKDFLDEKTDYLTFKRNVQSRLDKHKHLHEKKLNIFSELEGKTFMNFTGEDK